MITRNRPILALEAIACYLRQDYQNRELIIVDGGDDGLDVKVLQLHRPDIVWVRAPAGDPELGDLRNLALLHANGEFFAQWDDDDWYAPNRISSQFGALGDKKACLLKRWTIAWPERGIYGISHVRPWEGSILARLTSEIVYRSLRSGEDTEMIERCLQSDNSMVLLDMPELYVYRIHGANTFPASHFERLVNKPGFEPLTEEEFDALRRKIGFD